MEQNVLFSKGFGLDTVSLLGLSVASSFIEIYDRDCLLIRILKQCWEVVMSLSNKGCSTLANFDLVAFLILPFGRKRESSFKGVYLVAKE